MINLALWGNIKLSSYKIFGLLQVFSVIWADLVAEKKEYCQLETFQAACSDDQVILMLSAVYGRMSLGRCAKKDYGSLGCSADVLPHMDRLCSGRRSCSFHVADLDGNQPCPSDLAPFLEANYTCVNVITVSEARCISQTPITIPSSHGYISSVITTESGRGGPECPWRLVARPGQKINLTLINFARVAPRDQWRYVVLGKRGSLSRPKICYQLLKIREGHMERVVTECEGSDRRSHAFLTSGGEVEVEVIVAKALDVQFLVEFRVVGCPNPTLGPGQIVQRKTEDTLLIRCNSSSSSSSASSSSTSAQISQKEGEGWFLKCVGVEWVGQLGNCSGSGSLGGNFMETSGKFAGGSGLYGESFPINILLVVSVGVALGVFIGGVLLVCMAKHFQSRRYGRTVTSSTDCYPHTFTALDTTSPTKTLLVACSLSTTDSPPITTLVNNADQSQRDEMTSPVVTQRFQNCACALRSDYETFPGSQHTQQHCCSPSRKPKGSPRDMERQNTTLLIPWNYGGRHIYDCPEIMNGNNTIAVSYRN